MENTLLVNIGNTNTTIAYLQKNNLKIEKIATSNIEKINFNNDIKNCLICSVNNRGNEIIQKRLKESKIKFKNLTHKDFKLINLSHLKNPNEIGVDLLSQLNYINSIEKQAIIISLGTATVIHCIKNKIFQGAIILPGIYESKKTITNSTDIEIISLNKTNNLLGLNTNEAISIGLINTIENFINQLLIKYKKAKVFYTGGNAKYFKNTKNWNYIENLEILGMSLLINNKK